MENEKYLILSERHKAEIQDNLPTEKDAIKLALYFQNFSDSTRLKILSCLSFCDMCVNDLSNILNINQTTISHQLKSLKDQNLIDYKRNGKIIIYFLKNKDINEIKALEFDYQIDIMWSNGNTEPMEKLLEMMDIPYSRDDLMDFGWLLNESFINDFA